MGIIDRYLSLASAKGVLSIISSNGAEKNEKTAEEREWKVKIRHWFVTLEERCDAEF